MRLFEFFYRVTEKFVPIDDSSKLELFSESKKEYEKYVNAAKLKIAANDKAIAHNIENYDKEGFERKPLVELEPVDKVFNFLDTWYMRYVVALAFVFLYRVIENYVNNVDTEPEESEEEQFEEFQRFLKMRKKL